MGQSGTVRGLWSAASKPNVELHLCNEEKTVHTGFS